MYKFQTLNSVFFYKSSEVPFIQNMSSQRPDVWDKDKDLPQPLFPRGSKARRERTKKFIEEELKVIQGEYCIYCGLRFRSKSDRQIEHILPKGTYPEFTFEPQNLALSCSRCNGFEFKSTKDYAIHPVNLRDYASNDFQIVHPYFDNIHDHLDTSNVVIQIVNNSAKGYKTRDEFELNSEYNILYRSNLAPNVDNMLLDMLNGTYLYY